MVSLQAAKKALALAENRADELGIKVSVAVVDEHGVLIAMSRMDGAFHISPDFALSKAKTSALLRMPCGDIAAYAVEGKPYYGINTAMDGEIMIVEGGLPIMSGDNVVGAVGVGGSADVSQDLECAKEAMKAFSK